MAGFHRSAFLIRVSPFLAALGRRETAKLAFNQQREFSFMGVEPLRHELPRLIVKEGDGERVYLLDHDALTIGRSPDNDIELSDLSSSRRHCQIVKRNGKWELVDLESRNGTLVNGVLVLQKELGPGDVIEIGRTRLHYQEVTAEPELPTMRLDTAYFLDPLAGLSADDQLAALKQEREIFLRILDVVKMLNTTRILKDVLHAILERILEVTALEHGVILLADERTGSFSLRSFRKIDAEGAAREAEAVARTLAGLVVETGSSIVCQDFDHDERLVSMGELAAIAPTTLLCLPFQAEGETIGFVYADNHREIGGLGEHQVRLAEILAAHAAIAIRNARLFEENRRRQRELEEARTKLENLAAELKTRVMAHVGSLNEAVAVATGGGERPAFKYRYDEIVTASPKMFKVLEMVDKVVESTVPVLIESESGTGKELIARAIHFNGPRAKERFVSENCAAIPANLLESEFFGYERGAFTGASQSKPGLFELAHNGTLFLDEIGDLPLALQSKFLRVLQNGEIRRVGGSKVITVDVRIVSATNQNLHDLIRQGRFREDLYYRLNVITIRLPPLRERKEDIPLLISHFIQAIAKRTGAPPRELAPEALEMLARYDWPGNVRELENEIERMAALSQDRIGDDLVSEGIRKVALQVSRYGGRSLRDIIGKAVEDLEEEVIRSTLQEHAWKKTTTATILGISRPTLDSKIDRYRIRRGRPPAVS
jgi:transcriptional regulator with GAF, ATPase, and Fis domain